MTDWKTTDKRPLLAMPPYLHVEAHTIQLPDGAVIDDWTWVQTPDFVNVAVVDTDGQFVLFRQSKYALQQTQWGDSLAPVGGYVDDGETPLQAAKREVLEELGYEAPTWIDLGHYILDANRGVGIAHAYLALDATYTTTPISDDLEAQTRLIVSPAEIQTAVMTGAFKILPWMNLMALALLHLAQRSADSNTTD